jgi:prolyl-tRNA synthetase
MGSYGIGPGRIMAAAVEQRHDADGIVWPAALAPYDVHVVAIGAAGPEVLALAEQVSDAIEVAGLSVLLDDRDRRPGEKFADADLIGCPVRVTVGKKSLEDGRVDLRARATGVDDRVEAEEVALQASTLRTAGP